MFCPNPECVDFVSDGRPGEYRDDVLVCPRCGTTLVHQLPAGWPGDQEPQETLPPRQWGGEPEPVFACSDPTELAVVRSILEGAGIPVLTGGEESFDAFTGHRSAHRFTPGAGSVAILVPSDMAEEARELLRVVEEGEAPEDL
jgi:hypothetical protein